METLLEHAYTPRSLFYGVTFRHEHHPNPSMYNAKIKKMLEPTVPNGEAPQTRSFNVLAQRTYPITGPGPSGMPVDFTLPFSDGCEVRSVILRVNKHGVTAVDMSNFAPFVNEGERSDRIFVACAWAV